AARHEVAIDHPSAMQFEDPALGETAADGVAECGARCATRLDQDHCLCNGPDGDGHDLLVGELADLPGTAWADIGDAPECGKDLLEFLDISRVAAGHDRQRSGSCAGGTAGDRRIKVPNALSGEPVRILAGDR